MGKSRGLRGALGFVLGALIGWVGATGTAEALDAQCATVKLEIPQELTLERQGFEARMRIHNGLPNLALEEVKIALQFRDEAGSEVSVSSDPNAQGALFFVRLEQDEMKGIGAIDGTGRVLPSTTAEIRWFLIPAPGAAKGSPLGTPYSVGATLTYRIGLDKESIQVTPDTIYVKPMPALALEYFFPSEVYGDDAFTPEIEPSIPFSLGVRVVNNGSGTAGAVRIRSGQPEILENEQGLLVGFAIDAAEVNGSPASQSLEVAFGDIRPGQAAVARWTMTCSLSGRFTGFTAEYSHADELGGALTSLLGEPVARTLVRDVLVDLPGRDGIRDFLAVEAGAYRVYESQGRDLAVTGVSADAQLAAQPAAGVYSLTLPISPGFSYLRLPDPLSGQEVLKSVTRSDGKRIKPENAWLSKSRNEDTKEWEHFFHLFDAGSTGSYTVVFGAPASQPSPPVLQFIADRAVAEGGTVSFIVQATDPDGTIPVLTASPLPAGASFVDEGGGTGRFTWTTRTGQAGRYPVTFTASDGVLQAKRTATLTVNPIWDTDGDGMADAWELEHFGDLSRDGTGDLDGDGVSDLEEYLRGTDPATNFAPTIPVVLSPTPGAQVAELRPVLTVRNSTDREGDPVVYELEVYADAALTVGVASAVGVAEGTGTTSWALPVDLTENTRYHWRVRATDGDVKRASQWAYGSFFVNLENEAPGAFALSWPAEGFEVDTPTPTLAVTNSRDPDEDALTYAFEVYEDETGMHLAASAFGVAQGSGGATSWTVDEPLLDGATYWWKAVATDEHGASTESAVGSFVVNLANHAPTVPLLAAPGAGSEVSETALALVVANAADPDADPDGDPLTYTFELDTVPTFDSPEKQAMAGILEGTGGEPGQTSWEVPGALGDDTRYYWRAKASDGAAESPWTAVATFFVSTANDPPSAPTLRNPSDGGEVGSTAPLLVLNEALDPEEDALTYDYEIYADAGLTVPTRVVAAEGQGLSWAPAQALGNDRAYHWRARAVDARGLAGQWMAAARFVVNEAAHLDPPAVALTLPGAGGLLTNQAAVALAWTASNPSGTALVSLYFDEEGAGYAGTLIAAGLAPEAGAYAWDVSALPDATYYVYAAIEDSHGAAKAYAPGPVTLDRAPPATSAFPPGGLYAAPQLVMLTADDEDAVIRYTTGGILPDASSPVYTGPIAVESSTVLSFFATDPAGNAEAVRTETYAIDTEPPAVSIASPSDGSLTNDPTPLLAYTASDGEVRVFVDGVLVSKVSGDRLDPLADGEHTVTVEATDAAGNIGAASVTFVIDTEPPMVAIDPIASPVREMALTVSGIREAGAAVSVSISQGTEIAGEVTYPGAGTWQCALSGLGGGAYQVTATATDAAGNVGAASAAFTVSLNLPPVLDPIGDREVDEGMPLAFRVTAWDPDGDLVELSAAPLPGTASFDPATGIFRWDTTFEDAGTYEVTFTAADGRDPGLFATETVTLTVHDVNRPPVLDLVGNREVPEGELLRVELAATDPDGDLLTFTAANLPLGAAFSDAGDGTAELLWTPGFDQAGTYPGVLFKVTDQGTPPLSAWEAIVITVGDLNRPPVFVVWPEPLLSAFEGDTISFTVAAVDPDGDAVSYSLPNAPPGATLGASSGVFAWRTTYDDAGVYPELRITATDSGTPPLAATVLTTIAVGDVNRPPVLDPIGDHTVYEGETLAFMVTGSDPDGDGLTFGAGNLPPGAVFDPETQLFSWTPGYDQAGVYPDVEFWVADDSDPLELDVELVTLTVGNVNRPPAFEPIPTVEALVGTAVHFTVRVSDPDGDGFTLAAEGLPPGASFDPASGAFTWTPAPGQAGTWVVAFTAADDGDPEPAVGATEVVISVGETTVDALVAGLIDTVLGMCLPHSLENAYLANLKKVGPFLDRGKVAPARGQLQAVVEKSGGLLAEGRLTEAQHGELVTKAQRILGLL